MIRFGTIGSGKIADEFITSGRLVQDFKLNAVYSRTEERAREFAEKYSVDNIFTDLEAMAKSDLIDAVYIASPNSYHAEQAILFMNNKKHVLCEKPVASNVKELKAMIRAAEENGVLLMEAMKNTFLPNFKAIEENMNKIGKVRRYFASYCQYSSRYDKYKNGAYTNTFDPKFSNGSIMDIGVYCIYPAVYLFGMPNRVKASGVILESGVDGEGSLILEYDDMDAVILHSKIANSFLPVEIQGEYGNIIIDRVNLPGSVKIVYRNGEVEDITRPQLDNLMCYEIEEFVKLINEGRAESARSTHKLSMEVTEVIESARKQIGLVFPADNKKSQRLRDTLYL